MNVHAYCRKCGIVHLCQVMQESEHDYVLKCDKEHTISTFTINKKHTSPEEETNNG